MKRLRSVAELERFRQEILSQRDQNRTCLVTSVGTCGLARGAGDVTKAISRTLSDLGLEDSVDIRTTGCHGFCEIEPVVVIYPERILYQQVIPADIPEIISESVIKNKLVERLLYQDPSTGQKIIYEQDIPFYSKQNRLLLDSNRLMDPHNIEDYIALGGYSALAKAFLKMTPEQVLEEVKKANLRGRGGAGFPTSRKWEFCRNAFSPDDIRYVICNADEGDPGAYMDRSLLEGNPHCIIEGMIIGAYVIGSHHGYVYIRHEYPLAVKNLIIALVQAGEYGLLGENILGSGFDFNIKVVRGGGAFVCGEESAMIASIEGKLGMARPRPPYPAQSGLWGKPTNINNVETWANVPLIINRGADWYSQIGTEKSKGTKIFSLVGKINNTGLVEVPMGITLREIVYDIGGGIPSDRKFRAVQTGGPSGGCIPESLLDLPIDFDRLVQAGAMMGSGGMIVMDEDTCMVDLAKYFVNFLTEESCGKCVPCREGLDRMLDILTDITEGRGKEEDIELLKELGGVIKETSLCALGNTAPNSVLTTIRYFRDEYEEHITEKRCRALVCTALTAHYILPDKCQGCDKCRASCLSEAIYKTDTVVNVIGWVHAIDQTKCEKCGACLEACEPRYGAVIKITGEDMETLLQVSSSSDVVTSGESSY